MTTKPNRRKRWLQRAGLIAGEVAANHARDSLGPRVDAAHARIDGLQASMFWAWAVLAGVVGAVIIGWVLR